MKIKVCGMKFAENISDLAKLSPDMMGLIFYSKSPRYVNDSPIPPIEANIKRVGVFVNADRETILQKKKDYHLDLIQLHGNESPIFCENLNKMIPVIKAFSIGNVEDFKETERYEGLCSYFLFDTKTHQYGGSGQKFDWNILDAYEGGTPFILSGGISAKDCNTIKNITHPMLYSIDINSRFEIEPGLKDINLLEQFINEIRS